MGFTLTTNYLKFAGCMLILRSSCLYAWERPSPELCEEISDVWLSFVHGTKYVEQQLSEANSIQSQPELFGTRFLAQYRKQQKNGMFYFLHQVKLTPPEERYLQDPEEELIGSGAHAPMTDVQIALLKKYFHKPKLNGRCQVNMSGLKNFRECLMKELSFHQRLPPSMYLLCGESFPVIQFGG